MKITYNHIRFFLILVSVTIPLLIILADYFSLDIVWRLFRFGHMVPMFGDLRTIPTLEFYDGIRENIDIDPWGRPYNYPEVWIYVFTFISFIFDPYIFFGTFQLIIYPIMFWKMSSYFIDLKSLLYFTALYFSPPILLLLERGNNDGIVFLIVLMATITANKLFKGTLLSLAIGLKLFPILGLIGIHRWFDKKFIFGMMIFLPLIIWSIFDVFQIITNTPVGSIVSYGTKSITVTICELNGKVNINQFCNVNFINISLILFFLFLSYILIFFRKKNINVLINKMKYKLNHTEIFFVFSAIFVGTLLLYGNYSYRLVFLLPAITVVIINFQLPTWRKNKFVFELLVLAIMLYLSPFIPKIGWYLPQAFAFILGVYFFSVIILHLLNKFDYWFRNQKYLDKTT